MKDTWNEQERLEIEGARNDRTSRKRKLDGSK